MSDRRLSVRKERLTELTTEELHRVAGAAAEAPPTFKLTECLYTVSGCTTARTCPRPE